jgi:glutamate-1-semialdehyde 2,1-aminomutase
MLTVAKSHDCYIEDEQGNSFVDTSMGSGAQIIGHGNHLIKKIGKQIKNGTVYAVPNIHTRDVNSYLKKYINPDLHNEYIFCNTGTEANIRAIRLARACTGKNKIAMFHGGWHGGIDGLIESKGVPPTISGLIKVLPYNDEDCFNKITPDLAAVIVEPVQGSNPRSDVGPFLQKLQKECSDKGVLLILDEVMTGFRLSARGGAGLFDIKPDIVTYGKVLGGGFPIGVVGGKTEIMETKDVFYGGTFSENPLTMYAAKLILDTIVNKKHIQYEHLNFVGELFRNKLNLIFKSQKIPMQVMGCGPVNKIIFTEKFIKNKKDKDKLEGQGKKCFYDQLKLNGVFVNKSEIIQLSMSHTIEAVNKIIDAVSITIKAHK